MISAQIINAVAPGKSNGSIKKDFAALFSRSTARRRFGQPGDIADTITFVASNDARCLTGNVLATDHGLVKGGSTICPFHCVGEACHFASAQQGLNSSVKQ